jgi:tRNA-specific 2-thiouridylase
LQAAEANWLVDFPTDEPADVEVQIRYNSAPENATVRRLPGKQFQVEFHEPSFGVSPGQLAAIFMGTRAIGCGWIQKTR